MDKKKEKKDKKIIWIILILLLIIALSIGFALFTSQLNIQSTATVSSDPSAFKVVFSTSDNSSVGGTPILGGVATGGTVGKDTTTITDLSASFTAPGQTAVWKFYSYNSGKYDAFLNKVTLGAIVCTPDGADASRVAEAAKSLSIKISVGGQVYTSTNEKIDSHTLAKTSGEEIIVTLSYAEGAPAVDGNFNVSIGDIILEYNSAD